MLLSRRLGLRRQLVTNTERGVAQPGRRARRACWAWASSPLAVQLIVAVVLAAAPLVGPRRRARRPPSGAACSTPVTAFNNAGFSLYPDSLIGFSADCVGPGRRSWAAIVIGGLGFPVLVDLRRVRGRWRALTLHSKVTLAATGALLVIGFVAAAPRWSGATPRPSGPMPVPDKVLNGAFAVGHPADRRVQLHRRRGHATRRASWRPSA